jgi:penicillin V acylase-like amidase (Ntn superfamily)
LLATRVADACTTVADIDPERPVVAYNFDFHIGYGLVIINKRDLQKSSDTEPSGAKWRSKFGSITFVQFGRDNPMAGMNEAGLVASQMWLDEARYEPVDARPTVGVLEWLQYLLDTSATVEEALAQAAKVRIDSRIPLHYKLADATGRAAVVEFLGGKRTVRTGDELKFSVLANSTYADSLDYYLSHVGIKDIPYGSGSLQRFARAVSMLTEQPAGIDPINHAFKILAAVKQPGYTRWNVVFDPKNLAVQWKTDRNDAVRSTKLRAFDLSCDTPVKILGVHDGTARADVTNLFEDYSREANETLIRSSVTETPFLSHLGEEAMQQAAMLPETSICAE